MTRTRLTAKYLTEITLGTEECHSGVPFIQNAYVWGVKIMVAKHSVGEHYMQWTDTGIAMAKILDQEVEE